MKNITLKLSIFSVLLFSTLMLFNACESKFDDSGNIGNDFKKSSNITTNLTNNDDIDLTIISQDSINDVNANIRGFMDVLNLTYDNSDLPFGLALFYNDDIDTISFTNLKAVVYYYNENQNRAKVWIKDNGVFVLEQIYSKISHFIANEDLSRINTAKNLNTENILLLIDQIVLPTDTYYSEFQTTVDIEYASIVNPVGDGETPDYIRVCNNNPDCSQDWQGTCAWTEHQSGGTSSHCQTLGTPDGECVEEKSLTILSNNSTPLDSLFIPKNYKIRDDVLLNDSKLNFLIDDYYYVSSVIASDITLSIALDIYNLNNTNFLNVLKNYNNTVYADSVLINSQNKPYLLSICNKSKNLTTDTRVQGIFNNIISQINTYENKTITYIKNN